MKQDALSLSWTLPKTLGIHLRWIVLGAFSSTTAFGAEIGREVSVPVRLSDGQEMQMTADDLAEFGQRLFTANWTGQEGGGRPLTKGTGAPLSDPARPLVFPRNFNRISAPDANSCAGCHNAPFGTPGGGGDIVANVFVLGQRFDFATFGGGDGAPTGDSLDERGEPVSLQSIANSRATLGMFGSGYIEMLARQITATLREIRDEVAPGETRELTAKGISFGMIGREPDGTWNVGAVEGIPAASLQSGGASDPPSLILRPFHQAGRVVSIREFTNNAFNHHHGIQSTERFGVDTDPDGDGTSNEMSRAEVTAATVFQAVMAVPGRVIPNDPEIEEAVLIGEAKFQEAGCAACHIPSLALDNEGWKFSEPNPYNPPGNLRPEDAPSLVVDLSSGDLPGPRLEPDPSGVVHVPAFTDLKLHDITTGIGDPNREPLDMQFGGASDEFFAGNGRFLTRKLWDAGNKPNHYHHGQYTTLRESVEAHAGEALAAREAYAALSPLEQSCVIEFLKTLQVLPPNSTALIVDELGQPKIWPPNRLLGIQRADGTVTVTWQGSTGLSDPRRYQLQRCTDLGIADWTDIGSPTSETSVSRPTSGRAEFFRVVLLSN